MHYGPFLEMYLKDSFEYDVMPLYEDHIHFFEPVRRLHGAFIAGHIKALEQKGKI